MKPLIRIWHVCAAIATLFIVPTAASAQVDPQATPFTTSDGCARYQVAYPRKAVYQINLQELKACIDALKTAIAKSPAQDLADRTQRPLGEIAEAAEQAAPGSLEDQRHLKLKKIYLAYSRIRIWYDCALRAPVVKDVGASHKRCVPAGKPAKPGGPIEGGLSELERADLEREYGELSEELHEALRGHGLTQPFAATLVTAFTFANAGDASDTGSSTDSGGGGDGSGTSSSGAGYVVFESVHFFARPERRFDLDLSGTIGVRPVLTMVEPVEGAAETGLTAQYNQAFVWSMHVEPNWRVGSLTEFGVFFGGGQTILNSTQTLLENGNNSQVAVTSGGEAGASFLEVGARLGIFAESLDLLHLSKGLLSPMLGFSYGYRIDRRFESIPLPTGAGKPQDRMFIRLSTSAIPLTDAARPDQAFTLTFSMEHEWARKDAVGEVPSGTRVLIRGDLNLFKVTKKG